jgi:hypothetical protein
VGPGALLVPALVCHDGRHSTAPTKKRNMSRFGKCCVFVVALKFVLWHNGQCVFQSS